jgi:hypothetical protein
VTCGAVKPWKEMQAGHFVHGRNNSVLFHEELVWPQCYACNVCRNGEQGKFTLFLLKKGYTQKRLNYFLALKHKTKKISDWEHAEAIDALKDKLVGLDIKRGV